MKAQGSTINAGNIKSSLYTMDLVRSNVHRFTCETAYLTLSNIYPAKFNWTEAVKTIQAWEPVIACNS